VSLTAEIRARLEAAFQPTRLEIVDESESHRGHSGWREGGETHFRVTISAPAFAAMSRIERHRAVHSALGREMTGRIHALALAVSG
jgi:BolA protein